ncbi:1-deoxy-D-xylulose-5-phosphate reductoisomerase [Pseudoclostridium thermosuccinogenes]|jgi:1-deoxy-D-xylulose-5-phosphate reductoisomerase|uniref:1-deoxy-D-xylulose-5-phosphate reductoisomerase n=1 Tax=Clostridium thermosuccinogenes TaxID=84032 RepID=UPI000CCC9F49|nr:1-deoxy-D-xylulose-5-phosphate reductoisomerase [Pseudoclostridium thermosuccinogenes]PNT93259.1 1-deoxy-D-xylulose-5-phosphate reductoisomerase [Pseudoclostridium thermosuccinogenes]
MAKKIAILGSTGSIGIQTLDVARNLGIEVLGLTASKNIELLEKQAREFKPQAVAVADEKLANLLYERLRDLNIEVYGGVDGLKKVASMDGTDTVVSSVVGIAGLLPTIAAIEKGKDIALANKETLVTAGAIVMSMARSRNVRIFPVDSEHSAIFQCLAANDKKDLARIILTASGGPFRGMSCEELEKVTVEQALKHPNWSMGSKITIDSATLMNKGFEVIEARWLFDVGADKIQVLVHPQSIIHSMVEYVDGSIIAQLGAPDMRIPIQLALTYPARMPNDFSKLDFLKVGSLTFEDPCYRTFPCLRLSFEALNAGGTMPAVLNAANEISVNLFLKGKIGFNDISRINEKVMDKHILNISPSIDDIIDSDVWARKKAMELAASIN